jgi:Carboxypeptidase regulatory-like domain
MKRVLLGIILSVLVMSVAFAQAPTAVILGTVTDSSGAAVAGAKVTARNSGTGQIRTAATNQDGAYRLEALPVGDYQVTTEMTGFKTVTETGLTLTVAQQAVENFTMQIGDTTQTVSVTAEAPLVETTTSASGGLVDSQRIVDLPLNGRNYIDLTLLQPGITTMQLNLRYLGLYGTMFVSNGAPPVSNTYLLDGANMRTLSGTNSASITGNTLGVDGILEYRVVNVNPAAEYGGTMGSQMAMVSKSGTNQFHGDAFEFLRNSALDARNFFDLQPSQLGGKRLPEFRRNNFGGALGGPLQKNKTFFFAVFEGLRQSLGTTNTAIVPTAGCHGNAGDVITVAACPAIGPASTSVTIAPQMAPILALYPLPNSGTNTYGFGFNQISPENYGQFRVDHSFSTSDNMFARYTVDKAATAL